MKRGKTKKVFFLEKNSPFEEEEKNQKNQKKGRRATSFLKLL